MVVKSEAQPVMRGGVTKMRSFNSLHIGDRAWVVAEVIRIHADPAHTPPKWWLLTLYDGESSIKVFSATDARKAGECITVELEVVEGKPFQGKRQLTYKLRTAQSIDPANRQMIPFLEKIVPREVTSKAELQTLKEGTRVKLFAHLLDTTPFVKGKFRKLLLADAENAPISLWFPMEDLPQFENLPPNEPFLLKAFVRTVPQNQNARYLAFESLRRGTEVYRDPLAQRVLIRLVNTHLQKARETLQHLMQHTAGPHDHMAALLLTLQSLQGELDPTPAPVPPQPTPLRQAEDKGPAQTIKFSFINQK